MDISKFEFAELTDSSGRFAIRLVTPDGRPQFVTMRPINDETRERLQVLDDAFKAALRLEALRAERSAAGARTFSQILQPISAEAAAL